MSMIKAGTKVVCPACARHLLTIKRNIFDGEPLNVNMFDPACEDIYDFKPTKSECCGEHWFGSFWSQSHYNKIHTENGWEPK